MNLSREITSKLPDWFNPVLVKEIRQTLHSKAFWITSAIIVVLEALLWMFAKDISPYDKIALVREMSSVLAWLWVVGTVCILQPAISRWAEERHLDAVSPERTTSLSAWQIVAGKLGCHALIILWTALLVAPIITYLLIRINSASTILREVSVTGVLCGAAASFVVVLNLNIWATLTAMAVRIRRNATGGMGFFGWLVVVIGTMLIMNYGTLMAVLFEVEKIAFSVSMFLLVVMLVYGVLLLVSRIKPEQCNRMYPARLGGYLLLGCVILFFWQLAHNKQLDPHLAVFWVLLWASVYISFQSFLAAMEPVDMPKRMWLDAPKNPLAKALWFSCGTGAQCAWLHLLIPFAILNVLFFSKCFDPGISIFLVIALAFICYAVIYGAATAMLRMYFPKLNGGAIFIAISVLAVFFDLFIGDRYPEIAYASPGMYLLQQLFKALNDPDINDVYTGLSRMVIPIVSVAWCMICLMLLSAGYTAMKKNAISEQQ